VTAARTPRLLAIVAAAALFTISACTSNSTPSDRVSSSTTSSTRDIPLQTKRQADVVAVLKTYGDTIAATVGPFWRTGTLWPPPVRTPTVPRPLTAAST
jgi:hypothetical protein